MGIPFGFGVRQLYDAHLNFWRPGLQCALRIENYDVPDNGYGELGFQFSPTGQIIDQAGFNDYQILPQPEVMEIPTKDVGLPMKQLMFGVKKFIISHTFVLQQMRDRNLSDPFQVWRDKRVLGIAYPRYFGATAAQLGDAGVRETRLFQIQSVTHDEIAGQSIAWTLICQANEAAVTEEGS